MQMYENLFKSENKKTALLLTEELGFASGLINVLFADRLQHETQHLYKPNYLYPQITDNKLNCLYFFL